MRVVVDKNELRRLRATVPADGLQRIPAAQLTQMAAQALSSRDARRAIDLAQAALLLDPEDSQALRVIGQATLHLGDRQTAQQAFQRAIVEDPHDWQSAGDLARLYAAAGDRDGAQSILALLTSDADVPSDALATLARDLERAS